MEIGYKGKNRYFGTFPSQDEAALANKTARGILETTKHFNLTAEEIQLNLLQAKKDVLKKIENTRIEIAKKEIDFRTVGVQQMKSGNWVRLDV